MNRIKIKGHFFDNSGYAKVNRNLSIGLLQMGVNLKIHPVNKNIDNSLKSELDKYISTSNRDISIDSIIPSISNISLGKYKILYTTIESNTIDKNFIDACRCYNEIWVTSDFCKDVLSKYVTDKNIYVFPNSLDTNLYKPSKYYIDFSGNVRSFKFLSIFNWSYRKGYDALIKSYCRAFTNNDDVSLILITKNKDVNVINKYINNIIDKRSPNIVRVHSKIDEKNMPIIYSSCNCFCLFSRGEGFCLPYAEASLCGIPVISANFGGHTMYLNKENSLVVNIDGLDKVPADNIGSSYWTGLEMASLKSESFIDRASSALRDMYHNYNTYLDLNDYLRSEIEENYSISSVCKKVYNRIAEIEKSI